MSMGTSDRYFPQVSLAAPQSGLHQLAAAAELKQQQAEEEEEMMLDLSSPDMMETGGQETPRVCCSPVSGPTTSTTNKLLTAPSPDSAIHSAVYSPSQSPGQSRHGPYSSSLNSLSHSSRLPCIMYIIIIIIIVTNIIQFS